MTTSRETEPLTADDETIRKALEDAFLPALLPALAQATGDFALLREDLRPPAAAPGMLQGGMSAEQQSAARDIAFDALKTLRDGGANAEERPIEDDVRRIFEWMTASPASDDYMPLLVEELAPTGQDPRAPTWHAGDDTEFSVAIIGAGMSGIVAGVRLKQAGVPFVIIEKNADVGGTWLENTYPGARVDVQSAFYSYSFAQKIDWPNPFSTQEVLLDYFRECADEQGIREQMRFNTEVVSATFDEDACTWSLRLRPADGAEETIEVQAVISAVGQLNRPKLPDIAGRETFSGPAFHSAQWDHSVDLAGKRVAVIGTGASAAQFVPEIAEQVAELSVFQRTPAWFLPVPNYRDETPAGLQWLFRHVPHYMHWYRFWLFWTSTDGLLPAAIVDENWQSEGASVSAANDQLRQLFTTFLQAQYEDRPDLFEKILPTYPVAAKRFLLDNGSWPEALKRDNVELITEGIKEITADGVVTEDGRLIEADVIIFGTGFHASQFLMPMKIVGRNGIALTEQWDGDARAYLGITVPNFPNFFMLYGPNTNIVVNGSIIYFSECEVQYVLGCLRMLLKDGHRAMDCRQDVHDAYNERIDEANLKRAWGASDVNSWYKNDRGRVAQNWPFNLLDYWQQTRKPDPADYVFL
ncbi:MAG: NAD(P)/FAD-dependent oxidoreductase [Chloroflexi bacterium]|nr:NAD(P)/FAD-dependent oxidoreductase [Chloroflexota bacterium]